MEATKCFDAVLGIAGNFLKYAAEYYDKLGSMVALGDQNGSEETKLQKESKQDSKPSTEPCKTDADEMQIETEKEKPVNGAAPVSATGSAGSKETKKKKRKRPQGAQAPPPRTPLLQIIAMQELDNINARYEGTPKYTSEKADAHVRQCGSRGRWCALTCFLQNFTTFLGNLFFRLFVIRVLFLVDFLQYEWV